MERERGPLLCVQPQGTAFCGGATARVEGIPWACPLSLGPSVSCLLQEATLDHPRPMKYWSFLCFLFLEIYKLKKKKLSLLFAQGQLLQALRPQDFQKGWGWGESPCLPGAASPILLPAGDGRVDKVCPCTIKYLNFVCVSVTQSYLTLATPWTVAHQAPLSRAFSRQEYWRGLPFPSPYF